MSRRHITFPSPLQGLRVPVGTLARSLIDLDLTDVMARLAEAAKAEAEAEEAAMQNGGSSSTADAEFPPAKWRPRLPSEDPEGDDDPYDPLFPGALLERRKHVLVTLGDTGVLWLSAPPARDNATADLLAVLPFFNAARHPALGFDFKLVPAPPAPAFVKCTGAGDTLVGAVVAALARGSGSSVAAALREGVAAAHIAVQSPAGESTVSAALSCDAVAAVAARDVAPVEEEYYA